MLGGSVKFYSWLLKQKQRQDVVGDFARYATKKDKFFPRNKNQLGIILLRYEELPEQRESAKIAHREWRKNGNVA